MLDTICRSVRNYFSCVEIHEGTYKIEDGKISLPFATEGDYILIEGSRYNDGIKLYSEDTEFSDEEFRGFVSIRAVPKEFISLVADIEAFVAKNNRDNITSESYGGYSYSVATGAGGTKADWPTVFRERLNVWRKI